MRNDKLRNSAGFHFTCAAHINIQGVFMLKIAPLFSGSSGNCILIKSGRASILVDAGLSCRKIAEALQSLGENIRDIDAVVVTHEHSDHTKGLDVIMRNCDIPVYANAGTMQRIEHQFRMPCMKHMKITDAGDFYVGDINVSPFRTSHDAVSPVGYSFMSGNSKVSVMTDTGRVTQAMIGAVAGSSIVLLESNHDTEMLENGPYPERLKRRILSAKGHLSNDAAAVVAYSLVCRGTRGIILGHLSEQNNTESKAYDTVKKYLDGQGATVGKYVGLMMAKRYEPSGMFGV